MFDNGYIFTSGSERVFLNTSLGCAGGCCYCYLSKLNYSNEGKNFKTVTCDYILETIKKNNIEINKNTLITLGCYSECWDEFNKPETIKLIEHFLKKGNQIQLSTKKQIKKEDLKTIIPLIKYEGQFVIFVSCATISKHDFLEKNTTAVSERFKTFTLTKECNIPVVLYIKPVLKNITILDVHLFKETIENYQIKNVVVGSIFADVGSNERVHFSNTKPLFYKEIDDELQIINELELITNVHRRSSEIMLNFKK